MMMKHRDDAMVEFALDFAAQGWPVIPLGARGKGRKEPDGQLVRHGVKDASCDPKRIKSWWYRRPEANIGIACGAASGFDVLDVDARHDGFRTLHELERKHGAFPETPIAQTGGGGLHILLKHDGRIGSRLGPGIDVKSTGGYIVAPPSIHPSGRRYRWDRDHHPDDIDIAPAPLWLARLAPAANGMAHPPEFWTELVANGADAGTRNDSVAKLAGHLLRRGVHPYVALDLIRAWNQQRCRPVLDDREVIKTVNSICRREYERRHGRY